MEYLNLFETDAEFNTAKGSFPSGANVSYVIETDDVHILNVIRLDELPIGPFVDLGLPSGKKWASCNLGATKPCDYGDYYMWGSTTPNTNDVCDWAHAPFNGGASDYDAAYFSSVSGDVLTSEGVLKPKYDAVAAATNGAAHMPTDADWRELTANTTSVWVNDYENSGVKGRLFTSKTDNTKKIFIPASGYLDGSSFTSQGHYAALWSSSWSSPLDVDLNLPDSSWYLSFHSDAVGMSSYLRYRGFCVRGVADK